MKIIFLDIDGVFNYVGCKYKLGHVYFVDPEKIKLLKQLIDKTGAKVILSSTWRYGWMDLNNGCDSSNSRDFVKLRDEFKKYGVEFMDYTPKYSAYRGDEIDLWLKNWKGEKIESFVIFDDDNDMNPYMRNLVRTSFTKGLEQKHINKAMKILN